MKKWSEIDIKTFKDIFDLYWNGGSNFDNKVIEIRDLIAYFSNKDYDTPLRRYFIGNGIKYGEWEQYVYSRFNIRDVLNKDYSPIDSSKCIELMDNTSCLTICSSYNGELSIFPFGCKEDNSNNILIQKDLLWNKICMDLSNKNFDLFDSLDKDSNNSDPLITTILRFFKEGNKYFPITKSSLDEKIGYSNTFVRIRSMELDEWKEMMGVYVKSKGQIDKFVSEGEDKILIDSINCFSDPITLKNP